MLGLEESQSGSSAPQLDIVAVCPVMFARRLPFRDCQAIQAMRSEDTGIASSRREEGAAAEMGDGLLTSSFNLCHRDRDSDKKVDIFLES